jgi:CHASE3 domain sensor protein
MSRMPLRVSLLMLCLAAIAAAGSFYWSSSRHSRDQATSLREFEQHARAARVAIADLRAAQQSYVAAGQGEDFWFAKVTGIRKEIDERISAMRSVAVAPAAVTELEAATAALQDFSEMDIRARDYTRSRQVTLASDMVFADGFELTKKAGDALDRALTAEQISCDASTARVQRQQELALAGAGVTSLLGLLFLVRGRRVKSPEPGVAQDEAPASTAATATLSAIDEFDLAATPIQAAAPPVSLDQMAALCGDLARITDTRALPSLLERTAAILDASGIVLWIADPDGRELSPIVCHGYPPKLATRMGTILRDAGNVTASAYRTSLLQTMKGDAISSGAIAVPLVAANGCVGVMAAEMNNGGELQAPLLSAATIVAAQLATLVGPPSARAKADVAS